MRARRARERATRACQHAHQACSLAARVLTPLPLPTHRVYISSELVFVEATSILALVTLSLIFEEILYFVQDRLKQAARACRDTAIHAGRHFLRLFRRGVLEFTVLGFQALVLWILRLAGFWQYIACKYGQGKPGRPQDGHQLLEAVEDVHFHLFIALFLHLSSVAFAIMRISGSLDGLQTYEAIHRRQRAAARRDERRPQRTLGHRFRSDEAVRSTAGSSTAEDSGAMPQDGGEYEVADTVPPQSAAARERAFTHVSEVGPTRGSKGRFDTMSMAINAPRRLRMMLIRQEQYNALRTIFVQHMATSTEVEGVDEDKFNFATYLELVINDLLHDLSTFPLAAWGLVLLLWGIIAIVSGVAENIGDGVEILLASVSTASVLLMLLLLAVTQTRVHRVSHPDGNDAPSTSVTLAATTALTAMPSVATRNGDTTAAAGGDDLDVVNNSPCVTSNPAHLAATNDAATRSGDSVVAASDDCPGAAKTSPRVTWNPLPAADSTPLEVSPPQAATRFAESPIAAVRQAALTVEHTVESAISQHTRWWGEKYNVERYVLSCVLALEYFAAFALARVLAGDPFYVEPPDGKVPQPLAYVLFFGGYTLLYVVQTLLLPGTIARVGLLFALPPFIDWRNEHLARRVVRRQAASLAVGDTDDGYATGDSSLSSDTESDSSPRQSS